MARDVVQKLQRLGSQGASYNVGVGLVCWLDSHWRRDASASNSAAMTDCSSTTCSHGCLTTSDACQPPTHLLTKVLLHCVHQVHAWGVGADRVLLEQC